MAADDPNNSAKQIFRKGQELLLDAVAGASGYEFHCNDLQDGLKQVKGKNCRVFATKGAPYIDGIQNMKDGIAYHAFSESKGKGTHKGFDIWFKTTDGELVRSSVAHFCGILELIL